MILTVLSDLRRNLMIRHRVRGFHRYDASAEVGSFEPIAQFTHGLARAEYQNGFGLTNRRNDRAVVDVEMGFKRLLPAAITCWHLRFVTGFLQG
jgi:hypothetical protein